MKGLVNVKYHGKEYQIAPGSTLLDLINKYDLPIKDPVAVIINGHFTGINKPIRVDTVLDVITLNSIQGKRVYENSVLFLFIIAFKTKFPKLDVFIQHSIHDGLYAEISPRPLTNKEIDDLKGHMMALVNGWIPIERCLDDWDVSLQRMARQGRKDVTNLFKFHPPNAFKTYKLEDIEEVLYLPILPNTRFIDKFDLQKFADGLVILMDSPESTQKVQLKKTKIFESFDEYQRWSKILKVRTVGDLNGHIMSGGINDLIKIAEALHEKKVAEIADRITKQEHMPRVVLIAGPSSSGKTTFSKRLEVQLRVNGIKPITISLDHYFKSREETPKDEHGNYDFEALEALDLNLFNQQLKDLLEGKTVVIPKFNFQTGSRSPGETLTLLANQIIIIEGIHGLNPRLTSSIDKKDKFKIYISPLTQLNLHDHDRIPATDTRVLRRIVRDSFFRGYSAGETLGRWHSVRAGEEKYIFPLQEEADIIFNSSLFYELSVLKKDAEKELLKVPTTDSSYVEARRLLKFLSYFLPIDPDMAPKNSLLKEFIGGSSFKY